MLARPSFGSATVPPACPGGPASGDQRATAKFSAEINGRNRQPAVVLSNGEAAGGDRAATAPASRVVAQNPLPSTAAAPVLAAAPTASAPPSVPAVKPVAFDTRDLFLELQLRGRLLVSQHWREALHSAPASVCSIIFWLTSFSRSLSTRGSHWRVAIPVSARMLACSVHSFVTFPCTRTGRFAARRLGWEGPVH